MELEKLLSSGRKIRAIGFDDAHCADRTRGADVNVAGVICSDTRFEGMLWGTVEKDGSDSTSKLARLLNESKFSAQVQVVITDGITFGGCNIVDLNQLHQTTGVPAVAVMRRRPDLEAFRQVVDKLDDPKRRWGAVEAAGEIHEMLEHVFQVVGLEPLVAARVLRRLTDQGKIPEPIRLAHLIGSAVKLGISGKRA